MTVTCKERPWPEIHPKLLALYVKLVKPTKRNNQFNGDTRWRMTVTESGGEALWVNVNQYYRITVELYDEDNRYVVRIYDRKNKRFTGRKFTAATADGAAKLLEKLEDKIFRLCIMECCGHTQMDALINAVCEQAVSDFRAHVAAAHQLLQEMNEYDDHFCMSYTALRAQRMTEFKKAMHIIAEVSILSPYTANALTKEIEQWKR